MVQSFLAQCSKNRKKCKKFVKSLFNVLNFHAISIWNYSIFIPKRRVWGINLATTQGQIWKCTFFRFRECIKKVVVIVGNLSYSNVGSFVKVLYIKWMEEQTISALKFVIIFWIYLVFRQNSALDFQRIFFSIDIYLLGFFNSKF